MTNDLLLQYFDEAIKQEFLTQMDVNSLMDENISSSEEERILFAYKKYLFVKDNAIFHKENDNWQIDCKDQYETLFPDFMNLKYTKIKYTVEYNTNSEYEVIGNKIQLSLFDESGKFIQKEISLNSKTDFDSKEDFVNKNKQYYIPQTESEEQESFVNEFALYGGHSGWYYGIWVGTESENPFSEESIYNYFIDIPHSIEIQRLRAHGLKFSIEDDESPVSDKLSGKTIVISGNFSISRDAMKELIAANGGRNSTSVSGSTSFLLAGSKPGPEKLKKCESLGIPVMSEEQFMAEYGISAGRTADEEEGQLTLF